MSREKIVKIMPSDVKFVSEKGFDAAAVALKETKSNTIKRRS